MAFVFAWESVMRWYRSWSLPLCVDVVDFCGYAETVCACYPSALCIRASVNGTWRGDECEVEALMRQDNQTQATAVGEFTDNNTTE